MKQRSVKIGLEKFLLVLKEGGAMYLSQGKYSGIPIECIFNKRYLKRLIVMYENGSVNASFISEEIYQQIYQRYKELELLELFNWRNNVQKW